MGIDIAVYYRVSSRSQSTRSQEPEVERWLAVHANGRPVRRWRDQASGATMARPGWDDLWSRVLASEIGTIVVWRIDRLGRTTLGLAQLFEDLRARRVDLVSIRNGVVGLDTPDGRMLAGIIASMSQYEREIRAERQLAGIDAAKARGVRFGRPRGTRRPLRLTGDVVDLIRRLNAEGVAVAAIARRLALSRQSVYAALADLADAKECDPRA